MFVDGCFWHGCPEHYVRPRSRGGFWARKLRENVARDCRQSKTLTTLGWYVVRLWEHEVLAAPAKALAQVEAVLTKQRPRRPTAWRVMKTQPLDSSGSWEQRTLVSLLSPDRKRLVKYRRQTRKW